jgi:GAF domain-containing protein
VKTYTSTQKLLNQIKRILAGHRPTAPGSPLDAVIAALCLGRHYGWVAIYLAVGRTPAKQLLGSGSDPHPGQAALPGTRTKILVSIKMAGREVGVLDVESEHDHAFGSEDRVLLEDVADVLARYLTGAGKFLVRKARAQAGS